MREAISSTDETRNPDLPSSTISPIEERFHAMTGVPAASDSSGHCWQGIVPLNWQQHSLGVCKEVSLLFKIDRTNEFDTLVINKRFDFLSKVFGAFEHRPGNDNFLICQQGCVHRLTSAFGFIDRSQKADIVTSGLACGVVHLSSGSPL